MFRWNNIVNFKSQRSYGRAERKAYSKMDLKDKTSEVN